MITPIDTVPVTNQQARVCRAASECFAHSAVAEPHDAYGDEAAAPTSRSCRCSDDGFGSGPRRAPRPGVCTHLATSRALARRPSASDRLNGRTECGWRLVGGGERVYRFWASPSRVGGS